MAPKIISVANQKGGVGKTTTTLNLAACLAEAGRRTLVIDLDPQCNATSGLGLPIEEGRSLYTAMIQNTPAARWIQKTSFENLDVIPSELDLAGAEIEIARMDGYLHCFRNTLQPMLQETDYHYVFVDCPPSLGILTMNALTASNGLLIPMQCEYYALEGLSVISRLLYKLRDTGANPEIGVEGILMTMFDGRTNLAGQVVDEVRSHFSELVYTTVIPRNVRLSEAPSHGKPIIHYDDHSAGAKAYRDLAREFLARNEPGTPLSPPASQNA